MREKNCLNCDKKFSVHNYRFNTAKFCSRICADQWWVGKRKSQYGFPKGLIPWSKLHPELCKPNSGSFKKGQVGYWLGKKHIAIQGKNNPKWTGTDYRYWRQKALERDNYTCQKCGFRDEEIMEVHHRKSKGKFPELRFVLENLQTTCPNCHAIETRKLLKLKRNN